MTAGRMNQAVVASQKERTADYHLCHSTMQTQYNIGRA